MLRSAYGQGLGCYMVMATAQIKRSAKFLLLILISAHLLAFMPAGESQVVSLSFKEAPLQKVFAEIRKQTGYSFAYFETDLAKAKRVNINITNTRVQDALNTIFQDQPLTYTIIEKVVVVKQKNTEKKINQQGSLQAFQPIDVRGRVLNERDDPVAGVTVLVKGTQTGTSTDGDGEFTLKNIDANATLVLSAVNIESIETPIRGQRVLDLRVKGKSGKLDEVQVIAYGRTSQRFSTGNVTTVKAEDIEKQPVSNPLFALQGRVPGLLIIQNTGMTNGAFTVRIQGQNSISNGNSPLIVVDGVPLINDIPNAFRVAGPLASETENGNNPIAFINPADIESIDILKDADATAIYGSRAANGAILITTKKGRAGKAKVNIELQHGGSRVARKVDLLNTRQYLDMRYEAIRNDGLTIGTTAAFNDLTRWDTTRYTDWQKELIGKTADYTNANASISGGTSNIQYLIGGTYRKATTVFPGDFANKSRSIHFNINTTSVNQKLRLSLTSNYAINNNEVPGIDLTSDALTLVPVAPSLYNADGSLNWAPTPAGSSTWNNPVANSAYRSYEHTTKILTSNAQISYTLLPGLIIRNSLGYNNIEMASFYAAALEAIRPENKNTTPRISRFTNTSITSWIMEPQLTFNRPIGKGILDVLTGFTIQKNEDKSIFLSASGFPSDLLLKNLSSATSISSDYVNNIYKYNALFGRLNFNWNKKYIINLSIRRDGSSRFGENNRFNNFWSLGTAWLFSEENNIRDLLPILSFGKLRISYGTTGSDGISDYQYLNTYAATTSAVPYQGTNGIRTTTINNPYLQWEETHKLQGGIELGFFNDRVLINATYGRNRSSNQLIGYPLPGITGVLSVTQNFPALVQNISWEFSSSITAIKSKNLSWISSFNLTIPRNKVVSFPNIEKSSYASGDLGVIIGQPLGSFYYYHYLGVDPTTGNYVFSDGNGNPIFSPSSNNDRNVLLSMQPEYYGGIVNTINYKSLTLDFLFQFIKQRGVRSSHFSSATSRPGIFSRGEGNQPVSVLDRWQKPGDITSIARFTHNLPPSILTQSDGYYSYDASFLRLKNVSLSWHLPQSLLKKAHLQNGSIYFRGQNLATITNFTGLDPETQGNVLPPLQTWTVGFKITL